MTRKIKILELIVVIVGIIVSIFTLFEIKKQTQANFEQISVLKENSEIANRLTIYRDFYPKYAIESKEYKAEAKNVYINFTMTNYSKAPLAYDNYFIYDLFNCGTGKYIQLGGIKKSVTEQNLRDKKHLSIAPGETVSGRFSVNIGSSEDAIKEIMVTKANFVLVVQTFLRLENIEYFDDFVDKVGFDLSDDFKINKEPAKLPPNTKRIPFEVPIKWNGSELEISDYSGCTPPAN